MFCPNCGKQLDDRAVVCPNCGVAVPGHSNSVPSTNILAIVGFVLSFFVSIAGLVCSIIARKQIKETGEGGSGFALAGIIISSISIGIVVLAVSIYLLLTILFFLGITGYL